MQTRSLPTPFNSFSVLPILVPGTTFPVSWAEQTAVSMGALPWHLTSPLLLQQPGLSM